MDILNGTVVQLHHEGIRSMDDLIDFYNDSLWQAGNNLHRPSGVVKLFVFGAKS